MSSATTNTRPRALAAMALLGGCVAGCSVGPDFARPAAPQPARWIGPDDEASRSSPSRVTADDADLARWWTALGDPELDALVARALAANPSIAQAEALVRVARAQRTIAASAGVPSVNASAGSTTARDEQQPDPTTTTGYRAGFDASWELDIFGGVRRSVEAAGAGIEAAIANERDVRVTLLAEVASTYVDLRAAQGELEIARRNLEAQRRSLELTRRRQAAGFVSMLDVAAQETQASNTESRIPALEIVARQSMYALATLLGDEPGALIAELEPPAPLAALPATVPAGLPSQLLERRPDIRRAEAELHAATAEIGVATAQLYPQFSLSGAFGAHGTTPQAFGAFANQFWSVGPAVRVPIFEGGALEAGVAQQQARTDALLASFKGTVLGALQEVESSMAAFGREQQRTELLAQSVASSAAATGYATELYAAGRTDFLSVLVAQRAQLDAESAHLASRRSALMELIALYKALGGGW